MDLHGDGSLLDEFSDTGADLLGLQTGHRLGEAETRRPGGRADADASFRAPRSARAASSPLNATRRPRAAAAATAFSMSVQVARKDLPSLASMNRAEVGMETQTARQPQSTRKDRESWMVAVPRQK